MTDKKPFLSGFWESLLDDKTIGNIKRKNLIKQINGLDAEKLQAFNTAREALGENPAKDAVEKLFGDYGITSMDDTAVKALANDPYKNGNALNILGSYTGAHPLKTAAGIGLGAMNVGGLTDNDYTGGQIAGSLIGGLGSKFLGGGFSPIATLAGGALGSLFDKLRQKQADSRQSYYR